MTFPRAIRQRLTSHYPPSTLQYLLEALGTRGHEAGARENENQVKNLLSGDPITCRILRLASTPLPPIATATSNVHILCRQVHDVNGHLSGRQQVSDHPWPPTPTQLQQVLSHFRTKPASHLNKPHIHTIHSTQSTHTGLTTAATTTTHMIPMDPKSTRPATTQLEVLTLHRYGAALNWTSVVKRPPRSHLWGNPSFFHEELLSFSRLEDGKKVHTRHLPHTENAMAEDDASGYSDALPVSSRQL
ncbi:hypothetical protein Taro_016884 [Colocasia esculenta]|uniref:Uncharacterized protein n=1 Tax=Colocasia esculenta TaxID=4460 RepID=A0A843UPZ9_COLES|nr:hypothetical protein [Colocasia esculenta]